MNQKRIGYEVAIGAAHGINPFEKACGPGSYPQHNRLYVETLLTTLNRYLITSVSDYGCGNMECYKGSLKWKDTFIDYKGYDVHVGCIDECRKRYPELKFNTVELMELPPSDQCLIIKDVLIHWFDKHIENFFAKVFDNFEYVIYMHSTSNEGYGEKDHRCGPHQAYGVKMDDEYLYGTKYVPSELLPIDRIIHKENIMNDTMKSFIVFKR